MSSIDLDERGIQMDIYLISYPFTSHKHLWTPLKCKAFQNIMENGAFALEEQMFHFP